MKSIKIIKNSFNLIFCLFCLMILSGCLSDEPLDESENTSGSSESSNTDSQDDQDNANSTFSESFSISSSKDLDILVVLPGGLEDEKSKLGLGLSRLISNTSSSLQSVDWQVAFISEDPNQNKHTDRPTFLPLKGRSGEIKNEDNESIYILDPYLQDDYVITELVIETMKAVRGSKAHPLKSIIQSVGKTENQDFFRENAYLAIIVLSKGQDKEADAPTSGVIASVQRSLGDSKEFTIYGIINKIGDTACAEEQTNDLANFSYTLSALIDEVGGITTSICEGDNYNSFIMDEVEPDLEDSLVGNSDEIKLKYTNIIEDTISLIFTPEANAQDWQFDSEENKITFNDSVLEGTTVQVSYDYIDSTTQ